LAQNPQDPDTDEKEELIVIGLVKRVLSKGTRLVLAEEPPGIVDKEAFPTLARPKPSGAVSVQVKVMKSPIPKGKSPKTMSDFKV
jgi:hypothetical protein